MAIRAPAVGHVHGQDGQGAAQRGVVSV